MVSHVVKVYQVLTYFTHEETEASRNQKLITWGCKGRWESWVYSSLLFLRASYVVGTVLGPLSAAWVGTPPHLLKDPLKHGHPRFPCVLPSSLDSQRSHRSWWKCFCCYHLQDCHIGYPCCCDKSNLKEGGYCFARVDGGFSHSKGTKSIVAEEVARLWGNQAERNRCWLLVVFLLFPFYSRSQDNALHMCKVGLPCSSKHLWKCPPDIPRGVFSMTPNLEELTWRFTIHHFKYRPLNLNLRLLQNNPPYTSVNTQVYWIRANVCNILTVNWTLSTLA